MNIPKDVGKKKFYISSTIIFFLEKKYFSKISTFCTDNINK
jgi:hypothetical protein